MDMDVRLWHSVDYRWAPSGSGKLKRRLGFQMAALGSSKVGAI
jgi:hypothetical protein